MAFEFKLPDLGEGITEAEVVKWRVKQGDRVEEHQVVVEVETDKAIVEVPSPKAGRVSGLCCDEGAIVKVGQTLITVETEEGVKVNEGREEKPSKEAESKEAEQSDSASVSVVGTLPQGQEPLATPRARALARKTGVDLAKLKGTGPGSIITDKDVELAAGASATGAPTAVTQSAVTPTAGAPIAGALLKADGPVERVAIKGVRKAIAKNLVASQKNTASVTGMDDADVTELWELRKKESSAAREQGVHLTFLPFFIKAVLHALYQYPMLNASVDEAKGEIVIKKYYNIGVAVQTPDGLMVSVVKDAGKKTILDLGKELQELSKKARERKIALDELKGSTFTITNYGTFGGTYATPIINSTDVAILGTGKIADRPWVHRGAIVARKILPLSLTFDHRVIDGFEAAGFLNKVIAYLEDPARIFIESA